MDKDTIKRYLELESKVISINKLLSSESSDLRKETQDKYRVKRADCMDHVVGILLDEGDIHYMTMKNHDDIVL